jgi:hypothetical protein
VSAARRHASGKHAGRAHAATVAAGRHGVPAAHHGHGMFESATRGPMRRDYSLKRFLALSAKYRGR